MANTDDKRIKNTGIWLVGIAFVILVVAIVIFIFNNGSSTDELTITGSKSVSGIRCVDKTQTSILTIDYPPISHTNTITAAFIDKKLSSISYNYEGEYANDVDADHARDLAETAYNSTMTNKYGLEITDFTRNISVDKNMVYISVTSDGTKKLNSKTAPIFMLDDKQSFPSSIENMKIAYENIGFSCEVKN